MRSNTYDDMGLVHLCLLGMVIAGLFYFWWSGHTHITYWALRGAWHLVGLFDWPQIWTWPALWKQEIVAMARRPDQVPFTQLIAQLNKVGYLFIGIPLLLTLRGIYQATVHRANLTRRHITAETLPWIMSKHAPAVIPSLYYGDLMNEDDPDHRWSEHPEEWVAKHTLLVNGVLDRKRCKALLVEQLGRRITTPQDLNAHERALFTVFASRLTFQGKDRAVAQELLDRLNRSCHKGTWQGKRGYPQLHLVDKEFRKYAAQPEISTWIQRHRYVTTLLHCMHMAAAKAGGGLPSTHFRWLKGMDRTLWYALNTSGRETPFMESAAPFTQALWEKFADENDYTLVEPSLEEAVEGVNAYLIKLGLVQRPQTT